MNQVTLLGHLSKDVYLKTTDKGMDIVSTSIAVNDRRGNRPTMFIDLTFFDKLAGIANQYLKKGDKVCIHGSLDLDTYVNQAGVTVYKHRVTVNNLEMLGQAKPQYEQNKNYEAFKPKPDIEINDDEIPF